jgi:hypothetical protein
MMVNDRHTAAEGTLAVVLNDRSGAEDGKGAEVVRASCPFQIEPLGQAQYRLDLAIPAGVQGDHLLRAVAGPVGPSEAGADIAPTVSRRHLRVE